MKKFVNVLLVILLSVTVLLTLYAVFSSPEGLNAAISLNIIWCYILLAGAIAVALGCAAWGLLQDPAGLKSSLLSLLLMVAVVVISYVVAAGHEYQIVDLNTGGYFDQWKAIIADTGILVTYVAFVGAIAAAIYSEVANALK